MIISLLKQAMSLDNKNANAAVFMSLHSFARALARVSSLIVRMISSL